MSISQFPPYLQLYEAPRVILRRKNPEIAKAFISQSKAIKEMYIYTMKHIYNEVPGMLCCKHNSLYLSLSLQQVIKSQAMKITSL